METLPNQAVEKRLKKWCDTLLDISRRNPSLNFITHNKEGRKKPNIFEIGADIDEIFSSLVVSGKSLTLSKLGFLNETSEDEDELGTVYGSNNLTKKFTRLKRDTESILEERGTHVLYMTFGQFRWKEEKISDEYLSTPILFVPVNIQKARSKDRYSIQISDLSDVEFNPTFSYIIKKLYKADLTAEVNSMLNSTEKEVTVTEVLTFIEEELLKLIDGTFTKSAWLSKFWFEKLVLFNDIQKNLNKYVVNENMKSICGEGDVSASTNSTELEMLRTLADGRSALDTYEVLDADSSQRLAIEASLNSKNFILIGPPGTGKSQTITNIIAECLVRGKKVLFVSEKLAALKVVEKKLRESNLGRFCLSLHGKDVKKKEFYSEIYDWYETVVNMEQDSGESTRFIYEDLDEKKEKLNAYATALKDVDESLKRIIRNVDGELIPCELNVHYIQTLLMELEDIPTINTKIDVGSIDEVKYKKQKELLERCFAFKDILLKEVESDWFQTHLDGPLTSELKEKISEDLDELKVVNDFESKTLEIIQKIGLSNDLKLNQVSEIMAFLEKVNSGLYVHEDWLNYKDFRKVVNDIEYDRKLHTQLVTEKSKLSGIFRDNFLCQDLEEIKKSFIDQFEGDTFRYTNKEYWKQRKNIIRFKARDKKAPFWVSDEILFDEIEQGVKVKKIQDQINLHSSELESKYMGLYKGECTNWKEVSDKVDFVSKIFSNLESLGVDIENDTLPESVKKCFVEGEDDFRLSFKSDYSDLEKLNVDFNTSLALLDKYFSIEVKDGKYCLGSIDLGQKKILELPAWRNKLEEDLNQDPSLLERWFYYKKIDIKIEELGIRSFIEEVVNSHVDDFHRMKELFEKRVLETLYMKFESKHPILNNFNYEDHLDCIEGFKALDKQTIVANKKRLFNSISSGIKTEITEEDSEAIKVVKKLGNQKYPRLPIRTAIKDYEDFILKLKPCWMMSPMSVCQYCPPDPTMFDIIIFDEASQVRPADSIGAIFRGKQIIVVGDPRQLPPTNFFQRITQEEDVDSDDDIIEESIIDEIKSKANNFVEIPLRWHYRSKSEDLFAFANENIYPDLKLVTFPNPTDVSDNGKPLGVRHVLVENGTYDRGKTRTNQLEADKVAELVVEHFSNNPIDKNDENYLSLGVIAFSSAQEKAIFEALYRKRKEFSFIEAILDDREGEHFFIKNLETVQGDERDHIIISVGYGPDAKGKMSNNFGPLNQEGGERRLNVAITRARRNLLLVSSFTHKDIFLNSTQIGPQLLLKYIQYCSEGLIAQSERRISDVCYQSPFDEIVANKLSENGIEVRTAIGSSDCKINMAVMNPYIKDSYLFSVETDGPTYFNVSSARDRERLKREILKDRGWDIYNLWATQWKENPEKELSRIVEKYNSIVQDLKKETDTVQSDGVIDFEPLFNEELA